MSKDTRDVRRDERNLDEEDPWEKEKPDDEFALVTCGHCDPDPMSTTAAHTLHTQYPVPDVLASTSDNSKSISTNCYNIYKCSRKPEGT
ncbi:hypothetical protein RUM43_007405 [Polyplax serrata]|uniref:Uncharacterized protein n=1 Tax=Polyplax serrata TaxID=468196 RepID=A0AAN8S5G2_POLSC